MKTLNEIERSTKEFADARNRLADTVRDLNDKIEALKRQYLPGIKVQVNVAAEKKANLKAAIEESAGLFKQPRTIVMHGIKIGLEKAKGKIEWTDNDQVVKLIEKHFPDQADVLIQTKKKPLKKALGNLTAAELKKLGIIIEDTGDAVVIRPTDSQIEKMVDRLLKEKDDDEAEEEAA